LVSVNGNDHELEARPSSGKPKGRELPQEVAMSLFDQVSNVLKQYTGDTTTNPAKEPLKNSPIHRMSI
jgi:hypothetical protein